jgi:hypothetical protein
LGLFYHCKRLVLAFHLGCVAYYLHKEEAVVEVRSDDHIIEVRDCLNVLDLQERNLISILIVKERRYRLHLAGRNERDIDREICFLCLIQGWFVELSDSSY